MKPTKLGLILILFATILSFSCKKSDSTKPKTNTDFLTQATWKFDKATVGGTDVSSLLQTCQTDNILTFSANGTGNIDEGPTKCHSTDPQTDDFTWNFANNGTVLHVSAVFFTGGSNDFNIVTLNDTQLVVSQDINIMGTMQNAVLSFKH
jgi:Lipocalin-like domain